MLYVKLGHKSDHIFNVDILKFTAVVFEHVARQPDAVIHKITENRKNR